MAARSLWKAQLVIGRKKLPVDLFSAIADRQLHLHLLGGKGKQHARVRQQMVDPTNGEAVAPEETRRGVEVERGRFVTIDASEMAAVEPKASRDVELTAFVPGASVDHRWYDRPYYLGPGRGHRGEYDALVAAMQKAGLDGFARWVMRKRECAGLLRPHDGALVLITLRHASEVIVASELSAPEGRELEERELNLAKQLVYALSGPFEHEQFHDEYRERVLELVKKKQKGKKIDVVRWHAKPVADDSLVAALQRSLKSAG